MQSANKIPGQLISIVTFLVITLSSKIQLASWLQLNIDALIWQWLGHNFLSIFTQDH